MHNQSMTELQQKVYDRMIKASEIIEAGRIRSIGKPTQIILPPDFVDNVAKAHNITKDEVLQMIDDIANGKRSLFNFDKDGED